MLDTTTLIRGYLLSRSNITSEVGSRVYAVQVPENLDPNPLPKFILLSSVGGSADHELPFLEPEYQFKCYGPNSVAARSVYGKLFDELHAIQNQYFEFGDDDSGYIVFAQELVQGQELIDPPTGWPFVLSFFKFRFRR